MSRTKPTEAEIGQIEHPCWLCGADAWDWCIADSGRWSRFLHSNRFYAWKRAKRAAA